MADDKDDEAARRHGEVERSHVHGFLNDDKKPGRKRPKPGDKDPNWKPRPEKPKEPKGPERPDPKPKKPEKPKLPYKHRDYRGTRGAIEDAEK